MAGGRRMRMKRRSSPAQPVVAQPRQVRKEATVGYEGCDAGELDLFLLRFFVILGVAPGAAFVPCTRLFFFVC